MKWYNMMPFFCCCCSVFYSLSLGHLQFSLTFNTSYSPSLIWTISASTDELQRARDIVNYFGCACVCHPDVAWVATKYFCTHLSSGSGICPVSRVLRSSISLCRLRKFFIFSWFNLLTVQMSAISNECSRPSVCVCERETTCVCVTGGFFGCLLSSAVLRFTRNALYTLFGTSLIISLTLANYPFECVCVNGNVRLIANPFQAVVNLYALMNGVRGV